MNDIIKWSATKTAENIHNKSVSVREVTEAHLARIAHCNPSLNALTETDDSCLAEADALDNRASATPDLPLRGVPVTIKSNIDQSGFSTPNGVAALGEHISNKDSPLVANLKNSGAVIIGRTNTPEFSMRWCTSNPLYGVSLNPWDKTVTPGGSSGGAAAAIAVGMGCLAHGNDLGGSLRYPAFCCGVTTIRPSMGRIPAFNPSAVVERPPITQTMSVQGPIARCIADVKLGLQSMSMRSSQDPLWHSAADSGRTRSTRLKVAWCVNPFPSSVDPAIENAVQIAVDGLKATGAELIEAEPPDADGAAMLWGRLLFTESRELFTETVSSMGSPEMNRLFTEYGHFFGALDLKAFLLAMAERLQRQRAWSAWFDQYDLLLMPTSLIRPFANDLDFTHPEKIPALIEAQKPLFPVNLFGLPAVALPTHVADGVPVGVQLIGPMHDDAFVLAIAERLEREIGTLMTDTTLS